MPPLNVSSQPKDQTRVSSISCIAGVFFTSEPPGSPNGRILTVFNFQMKIYVFKKNNYHAISLNTTYMLKELLKYNNYKYSL